MKMLDQLNTRLARTFIKDFDDTDNQKVRVQHGLLAGSVSRKNRTRGRYRCQ